MFNTWVTGLVIFRELHQSSFSLGCQTMWVLLIPTQKHSTPLCITGRHWKDHRIVLFSKFRIKVTSVKLLAWDRSCVCLKILFVDKFQEKAVFVIMYLDCRSTRGQFCRSCSSAKVAVCDFSLFFFFGFLQSDTTRTINTLYFWAE